MAFYEALELTLALCRQHDLEGVTMTDDQIRDRTVAYWLDYAAPAGCA
jgi:hypothetical protein